MINRPRRLRQSPALRRMVRETHFSADSLILPLFVTDGRGVVQEIDTLKGNFRYSPDRILEGAGRAAADGIRSLLLFGVPDKRRKDEMGSEAWNDDGAVQQAIGEIKRAYPDMTLISDICLCEYTAHGHCGVLSGQQDVVDNDATLPLLAKAALSHARAGADIIAPSDMMDGRVAAIRSALDIDGFANLPIMSYSAKYASAFYGPFRDAVGSAPSFGDRRAYQMDSHNAREALLESALDIDEGADILMVKPALSYLDVIYRLAQDSAKPVAAYSVSGEYAMVQAAAAAGLIDEYGTMCEIATSIFRAGADILISYWAGALVEAIRKGDIG